MCLRARIYRGSAVDPFGMRFVILGAGAIGGVVGGRLHQHGFEVVLVARGAHLDAIRSDGLRLEDPDGHLTLSIPAVGSVRDIRWSDTDVVMLAVKGQDTIAALDELRVVAPPCVPVFCLQNGTESERRALRVFPNIYGVCVMCPATFLVPGVVQAESAPVSGLLDLGRYPIGIDDVGAAVAGALSASSFDSRALADVMPWKRAKLLMNLRNAVHLVCAPGTGQEVAGRAREEAIRCFDAARLEVTPREADLARRNGLLDIRPVAGRPRGGSSSWQSVARGTGSIETDLLNGEVVLLGRLHGVPTPVNTALQALAHEVAREVRAPFSMTEDAFLDQLDLPTPPQG
jgi:2-dehydropantoate 2-reductase